MDLGDLTWQKRSDIAPGLFSSPSITDYKFIYGCSGICDGYAYSGTVAGAVAASQLNDKTVSLYWQASGTGSVIYVLDASKDSMTADQFKAAMDGIQFVYELATPTTESADYYTSPQTVSNWGTEEFVTTMDIPIPVGHETDYIIDLKAKLESAPDNPDSDGYYLMRRYQGENSYVEHVNELPTEPTTDGSYTLKSTVTSGESVLSWEPDVP